MTDGPAEKVEDFLSKQEDILTSVARTIGSTLGTVAAKVNAVSSPRKKTVRKRRPAAKAAKKKRPAKKSERASKPAARKRTARKKSRR